VRNFSVISPKPIAAKISFLAGQIIITDIFQTCVSFLYSSAIQSKLYVEGGLDALRNNEASLLEDVALGNPIFRFASMEIFASLWNSWIDRALESSTEGKIIPLTNMPVRFGFSINTLLYLI